MDGLVKAMEDMTPREVTDSYIRDACRLVIARAKQMMAEAAKYIDVCMPLY